MLFYFEVIENLLTYQWREPFVTMVILQNTIFKIEAFRAYFL